jgi:hypothetical protein
MVEDAKPSLVVNDFAMQSMPIGAMALTLYSQTIFHITLWDSPTLPV